MKIELHWLDMLIRLDVAGGAVKLMLCVSIVRNKIIGALRVDDDFKINEKNIFG